jgi:hypothetical protein
LAGAVQSPVSLSVHSMKECVMRDLAVLRLSQDEFDTLSRHCARDPGFPRSWEAWQALMSKAARDADAAGLDNSPIRFDVDEFVAWCRGLRVIPCLDALRAYTIVHRAQRTGGLV